MPPPPRHSSSSSHGDPPPPPPNAQTPLCDELPSLVSAFVDTFVDYVVGGQFLGRDEEQIRETSDNHSSAMDDQSSEGRYHHHHNHNRRGMSTYRPPVRRLVAIGDIHGDLAKARESLKIAGVMDDADAWIGGDATVVQVGDVLDRGGEELKVLYLLEKLGRQARRSGGDLIVMNGNHEVMNMEGDFRYATHSSALEFQNWAYWYERGSKMKELCNGDGDDGARRRERLFLIHGEHGGVIDGGGGGDDEGILSTIPMHLRARFVALRPGGPISTRFLAKHPTVVVIGKTVFAHGGVLPSHASYGLERMNEEVREWILGKKGRFGPSFLHGRDAVVWVRKYSEIKERFCDCDLLERALDSIHGSERMIVGHTIQQPFGINGACMNRVIRVDVGMSSGCGDAPPEVLEIKNDEHLKVLSRSEQRQIAAPKKPVVPPPPREPFWKKREQDGLASLLSETSVK